MLDIYFCKLININSHQNSTKKLDGKAQSIKRDYIFK